MSKDMQEVAFAWLASALLVLFALGSFFMFTATDASTIGELMGGAGSAIAFIWLIVSTRQQAKLLKLQELNNDIQRNDLQVQREALAAQRLELNRMGTHGAIRLGHEALRLFEDTLRSNMAPEPRQWACPIFCV